MSITSDVDRGLAIREEIKKLESELAQIEQRLRDAGLARPQDHVPLVDEDRDGKRWLAKGTQKIVPVIFTADLIIGEFAAGTPRAASIRTAARGKLDDFFKPINKFENRFKDGKIFRNKAALVLEAAAPNFITQCLARDKSGLPKSRILVSWDEPEPNP
jgi:hypothetical protein